MIRGAGVAGTLPDICYGVFLNGFYPLIIFTNVIIVPSDH